MPKNFVKDEELIRSYQENDFKIDRVAASTGVPRTTVLRRLKNCGAYQKQPLYGGKLTGEKTEKIQLPSRGSIKRYILTSAQNNTLVHKKFWENLTSLSGYYHADIFVGTFTYNKDAYGSKSVKRGSKDKPEVVTLWYDEKIEPYIKDQRVQLAPTLTWCGEMNILPTADRPLSGFESYTGESSGIFPHAKIALESISNGKYKPTKFNYTTGTVTQVNYLKKKAGLKAEHHHIYGCLIVEVDHEGRWFVRQINAETKTGRMYDLNIKVQDGQVTKNFGVEAITWGDIHQIKIDPTIKNYIGGKVKLETNYSLSMSSFTT